jgi:hypothetical protein
MRVGPLPSRRAALALVTLMIAATAPAAAQQTPVQRDTTRAQIQRTLRAFYFNLAHDDWEALTADILPAKVVAHRSAPEALEVAARPAADAPAECATPATPSIDSAIITLDGDWAQVSVPRCTEPRGADEFRLIRFQRRWRFVHIDLLHQPLLLSSER